MTGGCDSDFGCDNDLGLTRSQLTFEIESKCLLGSCVS